MATITQSRQRLRRLIRRRGVVELQDLFDVLGTQSRMTVFRHLRAVGYLTSYSHRSRYYTLTDIPDFDEFGLWFQGEIGFSRAGTLKETVALQVEETPQGRTHGELSRLLRVRAHNTLIDLVRAKRIGRKPYRGRLLYVSANLDRAAEQIRYREETDMALAEMLRQPSNEEVIEVLVEALREAPEIPAPELVAHRLVARGVRLEPHHVKQVYEKHGLTAEKKTARHSLRPSRR